MNFFYRKPLSRLFTLLLKPTRSLSLLLLIFLALYCLISLTDQEVEATVALDGEWNKTNSGIDGVANIIGLASDSGNWNTLYAYTERNGVYKSTNGGQTWSTASDGLPATPRANFGHIFPNILAIDPNNSSNLYLNVSGEVYRSSDAAGSWSKMSNGTSISCGSGLGSQSNIVGVVVDSRDSDRIFAGTVASGCAGGIFRIADLTQSEQWEWIAGQDGAGGMNNDGWELTQSKANPNLIFSSSVHTVARKSTDNGVTWTSITPAGLGDVKILIRSHPTDSNYLLAIAGPDLYKSTNQGSSWNIINNTPEGLVDLQFAPSDGDIVYMTAGGHLYKSTDKGNTWSQVDTLQTAKPLKAVVVNSTDSERLYISTGGSGIMKSDDGGVTLVQLKTGLPTQVSATHISVDPSNQNHYFAFVSGQGIYQSSDKGENWSLYSSDFEVSSSFKSFWHPENANIAYAALGNLYRSDDKGITWENISPSESADFVSFTIHPNDPDIVYAGSYSEKKIYKSSNGGESWSVISQTLLTPQNLAISYSNPNILYCACFDGLWKSSDGGVNWENIFTSRQDVFGSGTAGERFEVVNINPENPDQVYAANRSNKGFISDDGGVTWSAVVTGQSILGRATFSIHNQDIIYVSDSFNVYILTKSNATYTSSTLPADGIGTNEYFQSKYFGIIEDISDSERILSGTGDIYVYDTSEGGGSEDGGSGGTGTNQDPTFEEIIENYGLNNSEIDQNEDTLINGFDFVLLVDEVPTDGGIDLPEE